MLFKVPKGQIQLIVGNNLIFKFSTFLGLFPRQGEKGTNIFSLQIMKFVLSAYALSLIGYQSVAVLSRKPPNYTIGNIVWHLYTLFSHILAYITCMTHLQNFTNTNIVLSESNTFNRVKNRTYLYIYMLCNIVRNAMMLRSYLLSPLFQSDPNSKKSMLTASLRGVIDFFIFLMIAQLSCMIENLNDMIVNITKNLSEHEDVTSRASKLFKLFNMLSAVYQRQALFSFAFYLPQLIFLSYYTIMTLQAVALFKLSVVLSTVFLNSCALMLVILPLTMLLVSSEKLRRSVSNFRHLLLLPIAKLTKDQ